MAFGNVIPIDAEVGQQLARRQLRFRRLVAALVAVWVAILVPTLLFTPLPPVAPFAVLALMVLLAEHRFVLFGDETSMSASIIVIVASIFVFADTAPLAGPMLIASIGGIYLPHIRSRAFLVTSANVAVFGISATIATSLASGYAAAGSSSVPITLGLAIAGSAAYWYANSVLTGFAGAVRQESSIRDSVRAQAVSEWPVLLLAVAAGLTGLTADNQAALSLGGVALLLGLFEIYILRADRREQQPLPVLAHTGALGVGLCAALLPSSRLGALIGSTGAFAFVAMGGASGRERYRALVVSGAIAAGVTSAALGAPVVLQFGCGVGLSIAAAALASLRPKSPGGTRLPALVSLGLLIPGRIELEMLALATTLLLRWPISLNPESAAVVVLVAAIARTRRRRSRTGFNTKRGGLDLTHLAAREVR